MPFTDANRRERLLRALRAGLAPFDAVVWRVAVRVGHVALAVLIATGETLRWVDYRDTLISAPTVRAVHAMAGCVLAAALLLRIGCAALALADRIAARRAELRGADGVPRPRRAFKGGVTVTAAGLLDAAWWIVIGWLVLSGLERYLQLRHGLSVLPLLSPPGWWALHRPLLPYLYAVLLLTGVIRGKLAARRALSYLYTP